MWHFPVEELEPILYDKESILLKCHSVGQPRYDIVEELLFLIFFLLAHMKLQCNLLWYLIKPYNVLLIIKHSRLVENDPAEEITSLGFWQTPYALTIIDFSLCPGVTGE